MLRTVYPTLICKLHPCISKDRLTYLPQKVFSPAVLQFVSANIACSLPPSLPPSLAHPRYRDLHCHHRRLNPVPFFSHPSCSLNLINYSSACQLFIFFYAAIFNLYNCDLASIVLVSVVELVCYHCKLIKSSK